MSTIPRRARGPAVAGALMSGVMSIEALDVQQAALSNATRPLSVVLLFPDHELTDHRPSGDGLVAFGFISALARRGHRVHVAVQRLDLKNQLPGNVTIHRIGTFSTRDVIGRVQFILQSRALVRRLMRSEAIDLVHQLNPVCNGMSSGMLGLPLPLILGTFVAKWPAHGSLEPGITSRVKARLGTFAGRAIRKVQERRAAAFLVTTPAALSRLSSTRSVLDRVHWLPHGIDMTEFTPFTPAGPRQPTILFLANVSVKKGIFTLLDAFDLVHREFPTAQLIIAGKGPASQQVEQLVASKASAQDIQILGPVDRSVVPALMAQAAVYCLPSFGEPYATTVIEAMACAKPVIVSDSGGLPDLISDEGGRRVRTGSASDLAAALIEILGSPALQERMGAHNRAVVARDYDWPRVIDKLESIYLSVLGDSKRK